MLVLTRKTDQRIQIGESITITVLRVRGRSVQLGIEAPASTPIVREELVPQPADGPSLSQEGDPAGPPASDAAVEVPAGEAPSGQPVRRLTARRGHPADRRHCAFRSPAVRDVPTRPEIPSPPRNVRGTTAS